MKCKRQILAMVLVLMQLFLAACAESPSSVENSEIPFVDTSKTEALITPGDGEKLDLHDDAGMPGEEKAPNEINAEIIAAATGTHISDTLEIYSGQQLVLDADVDVDGVDRISKYNYVLSPVSEELRLNLFSAFFGERAGEAVYDEKNDLWRLENSSAIGDYYLYDSTYPRAGATIPGEESFYIEYRNVDLYPFDDNLLPSVFQSNASISSQDAVSLCDQVVAGIADLDTFTVDYIHAYGTDGRRPYYKIMYKRLVDGMPVTSYNDIYFLVDNDGIEKVFGSLYAVEETGLTDPILSLDAALDCLRDNAAILDFREDSAAAVERITLEYIVTNSLTGATEVIPVWRFWLGAGEDQMNLQRGTILAVNAVSGDLIYEERGNTF